MSDTKAFITAKLKDAGVSMECVFIPFSKSRNADGKRAIDGKPWLSLNWKVTIKRNDREVISTDYSAGSGHAPASSGKVPSGYGSGEKNWRQFAVAFECENGFRARPEMFGGDRYKAFRADKTKPLLPEIADVFYSLVSDYSVLDYATYEEWGPEMGFDVDSRKGEAVYRACMEMALKMRAGFGEQAMIEFAELFQDY